MTQTQGREIAKNTTPIMSILGSDGTLRLTVDEGTEGAKLRTYETSDGKQGSRNLFSNLLPARSPIYKFTKETMVPI